MTRLLGVLVLSAAAFGCAHVPKPQELLDLYRLREAKDFVVVQEKQPDLGKESEDSYWRAVEAWKRSDLEQSRYWATLGAIKLRTALTTIREEAAQRRVEEARKQLTELRTRQQDLQAKIHEADEQLSLLAKLAAARQAAKDKERQLTEAQQREEAQKRRAEAQMRITETQLALKMAETVEAVKYAPEEYAAAQSLLARAEAAFKEGRASDANATAEMAKSKADAALGTARPLYLAARKAAERQARNQALQKDAAAIDGVTFRMRAIGDTQQLILPVADLFKRSDATVRPDKRPLLTQIGLLLQRYPEYPVVVNGYTSSRIRPAQQWTVSQARAQAVAEHFIAQGAEPKRIAVAGRAAENPVAAKASPLNDRVEIIFLFQ
ncbi:MAG TPA: OmpA family protein [Polyangia bacterium]|jgi:outer membrane protein OmpA-like peptidoglycan-associated protein